MKSSKIENILDYKPQVEDSKALSPFTYYKPFQSSFDPEFSISSQKPTPWPNTSEVNNWSQVSERPSRALSYMSSSISNPWDLHGGGFISQPQLKDSFMGSSSFARREPEGRSICNTTWRSPTSPKPSSSGYKDNQASKYFTSNAGGLEMYSHFPLPGDPGFLGQSSSTLEGTSFRTNEAFGHSSEQLNSSPNMEKSLSHSSYYPLKFKSSAKNIRQNFIKSGNQRPMMCNFCKNNKEVPDIYLNHYLYDPDTKILSCPVLRKHVCEICGGTGDQAHTLQYCPVNRERGLQSKVPVLLKTRTITNSTGKIRRN